MHLFYSTTSKSQKAHKKNIVKINKILLCNIGLLILLFSMCYQLLIHNKSNLKVLGIAVNLESSQILELINQERLLHSLSPLEINNQLNEAALLKANDMLSQNYWDHYAPNSKTPWQFINQTGYIYKYAGENLAKGFYDEKTLVQAWMDSPLHRANILNDKFTQTGISTIKGEIDKEETIFIIQLFATPFSTQELELIKNNNALIVNQNSEPNPPVIQTSPTNSTYLSTKLLIGIILLLLFFVILLDIKKHTKKLKFNQMAKRYWLNLSLYMITGSIYMLTIIY